MAVKTKIQMRRGTASEWSTTNPTLAAGEIGYVTSGTDTWGTAGQFKIGDGSSVWKSLAIYSVTTSSYASTSGSTGKLTTSITVNGTSGVDWSSTNSPYVFTAEALTLTGNTIKSTVVNSSLIKIGPLSGGTAGFVKIDASGNLTSDSTTYISSTLSSGLTLASGATSLMPLKFIANTSAPTPVAGGLDYDGSVFYGTPKLNSSTYGRGLIPTTNILTLSTVNTQSTIQSTTGATTNDYAVFGKSIYLAVGQTYFVEMYIAMTHAITMSSGTGTITFYLKGPANTGVEMNLEYAFGSASFTGMSTTTDFVNSLGLTKQIVTSSVTVSTKYDVLKLSGLLFINTSGLFSPTLTLYAGSGASTTTTTVSVQPGSYCKVTPLGSSIPVNIGGWA